ncbi:undecaprenyldiphospho-muramoylpentapeptide beta-N-acetylglucosaminyltransferase [Derxia gummosa]|uniref:UDP-N-acetylglucosamine--N-acetylmuramyl-(pentapeptide) pyrophosphoryl-undecaprenol N-acetylglucosamine transferase n=1 Tax=Derxia gummosa DSM 723 TaxID=1121388 RepID=A0A8B6X203_9BURK|nr:undecaprenyldiphospho-muramoylpentapeptide beta-N-acetylglucosaminyltransferase [Derxia gummosa]
MSPPRHLVVVAAGTGGHVMPGLAVADEMRARGWTVSWIGTTTGMENDLVPARGIALDRIAFTGMRGKGPRHMIEGAVRFVGAMAASLKLLRQRRAKVVFGTGGYVCVPVGLMARLGRRPLVLLNADAALLLSAKLLKPFVTRLATGFPPSGRKADVVERWTGNPVRAEIAALPDPAQRFAGRGGPLKLLVVGGSLGARVLNQTLPEAVALMPAGRRPVITHQTGRIEADAVRKAYERHGIDAEVLPFIDDMARRYAEADVVLCRAGAITVSELCAGGVPSLLVPLKVSTTSHQQHNAELVEQAGAGLHLPQAGLTAEKLAATLGGLTRERLAAMAANARKLAKAEAAKAVADMLEEVAG